MARGSRASRKCRMRWMQIMFWVLALLVALSMILAMLPVRQ